MSFYLIDLQKEFLLKLKKAGKSENTLKNYRTDLNCFLSYVSKFDETLSLKNLHQQELDNYGQYLQTRYKADNSKRRRVQTLRLFFDFLVDKEVISTNSVRKIPTSPKFLDIPKPTPLNDVRKLWIHLIEEEKKVNGISRLLIIRNQLIFLLIYGAGLKVSDLATIKTEQVSLNPSRVLMTKSKRDPYTIPLPNPFATCFKKYIELLEEIKNRAKIEFTELFFNANPYRILAGGISPRGLEIVLEELRNKLKIELTPKSLRQACIFKWLHQKKADSLIKEWLGVTPTYSLEPFRKFLSDFIYQEEFLDAIYKDYK